MPDLTSHDKTAAKKKIALNGLPSNVSTHTPTQQSHSVHFKSNQNLKSRRGQNLISRIRNENISSEDDDEYTERLARALHESKYPLNYYFLLMQNNPVYKYLKTN